jgi:hypothetical protein
LNIAETWARYTGWERWRRHNFTLLGSATHNGGSGVGQQKWLNSTKIRDEIDDGQEKIATAEDANGKRRLEHNLFVGLSIINILMELTERHVFQRKI